MNLTRNTVAIFILMFLLVSGVDAKNGNPDFEKEKIGRFLAKLEKKNFNGAVLVSHGNSVFKKCYGFADKENDVKCSTETVYDIGSITKQFTGAAILKLEMMGKLSVDDKITKYFENVPEDKKEITIHHLLTHSAGFPGGIGNDYEVVERDDYVKKAFKTSLRFKVGSKYEYSNVGFSIAAAIIESASGMGYERFLNKHLFKPAGMLKTGYKIPEWSKDEIAVGYRSGKRWGKPNEKPWGKNAPSWHLVGNGGILSTVGDMFKWHLALKGEKILSADAKAKLYKRHIEEGEGAGSYYGYGWAIFPTSRKNWMVAHNGGNGVFFADFWRYLEEDVAIIMLTNETNRNWERIPHEISKSIFRKDYTPRIEITKPKKIAALDDHPKRVLISAFLEAVRSRKSDVISKFAKEHFTADFLGVAPIEKHVELLSALGSDIQDTKITSITIEGGRTSIVFDGGKVELGMRFADDKIAGVGF